MCGVSAGCERGCARSHPQSRQVQRRSSPAGTADQPTPARCRRMRERRQSERCLRCAFSVVPGPTAARAAAVAMGKEALQQILSTLSHRERRVLELRYGLEGEHPRTLEEVGRTFKVTRERIRQLEKQSLKKLRALAESQALEIARGALAGARRPQGRTGARSRRDPRFRSRLGGAAAGAGRWRRAGGGVGVRARGGAGRGAAFGGAGVSGCSVEIRKPTPRRSPRHQPIACPGNRMRLARSLSP